MLNPTIKKDKNTQNVTITWQSWWEKDLKSRPIQESSATVTFPTEDSKGLTNSQLNYKQKNK
jgi:hypothetical protein